MCRRSPDVPVLHPHPPARCVPPQGERMILGDEYTSGLCAVPPILISPSGAGASAGGIAGGGESPSVSAAPGISFDCSGGLSPTEHGSGADGREDSERWTASERFSFFRRPLNFQTREPATVRSQRTPQRFVPSLVASPSRSHARDVTRNSVSLQLDLACPQSIHKAEDNIVQSPPVASWWCSLCGGLGCHRPDCPLYRKTPQVRVPVHRHQSSDGADACREPEKLTS